MLAKCRILINLRKKTGVPDNLIVDNLFKSQRNQRLDASFSLAEYYAYPGVSVTIGLFAV